MFYDLNIYPVFCYAPVSMEQISWINTAVSKTERTVSLFLIKFTLLSQLGSDTQLDMVAGIKYD